jgi:hypothetical protein
VPSAISVNMLSRRLTTDSQPRRKNGAPPHATTGVARTSCSQITAGEGACHSIAIARSGNESARPTQNRRVMSASSGLPSSAAPGVSGSSAMPQIGQLPGWSRTISGCIGQVHDVPGGATGAAGLPPPAKRPGSATNRSRQRAPQKK